MSEEALASVCEGFFLFTVVPVLVHSLLPRTRESNMTSNYL